MVVVVLEGKVFVFGMVGFVVFVVGIVQVNEINQTDFFLMTSHMVEEMMEKPSQFQDSLDTLIGWRGGRQNQQGKGYGEAFYHCGW